MTPDGRPTADAAGTGTADPGAAGAGAAGRGTASTAAVPGSRARAALWRLVPVAVALVAWWLLTTVAGAGSPLLTGFAPQHALPALVRGIVDGPLLPDAAASLWRLLAGLALAAAVGVPVGLACGLPAVEHATRPLFQFTRMISPLAWAPVAVALFGVGHQPVVFLVAMAAVWPVLLNTAAGVRGIDPAFLQVARSLGATRWELLTTIVLPAIRPQLLTGLRLALGVAWVVLVPAEMLGVSSGLGYAVLNARDQLAYDTLMAAILVIGLLGYILDTLAQRVLVPRRAPGTEQH